MIQLKEVSLSYGTRTLYENVNLYLGEKEKVGLMGPNGSGKTSLLRLITGEISPDEGKVEVKSGIQMGYLPQRFDLSMDRTPVDEIAHLFEKEKKEIKRGEIEKTLIKLGFTREEMEKTISTLSPGFRMRIMLGRLLLENPDVLLLDEPTNYLDINSMEWFESYLKNFKGSYIIITHDRYLLDRVVEKIWSIENKSIRTYKGNYSYYVEKRSKELEILKKRYKEEQKELKKKKEFIQRAGANKKTAKIVKSRKKMLEKREWVEVEKTPERIKLKFPEADGVKGKILELRGVSKGYDGIILFENVNLIIGGEEKIALIGGNGVGKSTLLRIISGMEPPDSGYVWRSSKIKISFYQQGSEEKLHEDRTVIEEIYGDVSEWDLNHVKGILGLFLFIGDSIYKKIKVLSGGERTRLAIIKSLLTPSNLLILDEPGNHLDIETREVLERAIKQYKNAVIFVSHDRYMIDRLARKVLKIEDGEVKLYHGNYSYYLKKSREVSSDKEISEREKIRRLIKEREKKLNEINAEMEEAKKRLDIVKARELNLEYRMLSKEIEELKEML